MLDQDILFYCRLSRYAVESYLEQILSHGFFHADPVSFWALMLVRRLNDSQWEKKKIKIL